MSKDRMGIRPTGSLHICDVCYCTVTATDSELTSDWKWRVHKGTNPPYRITLCDECAEDMDQRRSASRDIAA